MLQRALEMGQTGAVGRRMARASGDEAVDGAALDVTGHPRFWAAPVRLPRRPTRRPAAHVGAVTDDTLRNFSFLFF